MPDNPVPRHTSASTSSATIRRQRIEIVLQRYPGTDDASAIEGLDYTVRVGTSPARTGRTAADGKITLRVTPGTPARLSIMGTTYRIEAVSTLEPHTQLLGVQRRLNMLGYNAGKVDAIMGPKTEYATLNFQADNNPLRPDGLPGSQTQNKLRDRLGE